jgi:hypothetical protein
MRWMVLWEAPTGLSMWTAAPAMGQPRLSACRYDKGIGYGGIYQDEAFCRRGRGKFLPNTFRAGGNVRGRDSTVPGEMGNALMYYGGTGNPCRQSV